MNRTDVLELYNIIKFVQTYYKEYDQLLHLFDSMNAALNIICTNGDKCNVNNIPYLIEAFEIWEYAVYNESYNPTEVAINNIINSY